MNHGERLAEQRKKVGLTQGQVAEYDGIERSYISQLESGLRVPTTWALIEKLAKRYETSADYILGLTDDPAPASNRDLPPGGAEMLQMMRALGASQRDMLLAQARILSEYAQTELEYYELAMLAVDRYGIDAWQNLEAGVHEQFRLNGVEAALQYLEAGLTRLDNMASEDTDSLSAVG